MSSARKTRTAYVNGRIYTMDSSVPWAEAILVEHGTIIRVGSNSEVLAGIGTTDESIDLEGRMVMPGIHDAHMHLLASGLKFRFECRMPVNATSADIVTALCDCEKCTRGRLSGWMVGGEYNPNALAPGELDRAFLDAAFPDTAVYLADYSIHHGFANSKALALAGIDASTPDPPGGRIVRRAGSTEPTGELVERATWAVRRAIPAYEPDVYREAVRWAMATANSFGITSIQEASGTLPEMEVLRSLDRECALSLHVASHLVWREEAFSGASQEDMEQLIARRAEYESAHVRTRFVKCWLDGAPLPPHFTQAGIDAQTGEPDLGKILISKAELTEALLVYDRQGVTLKIHCAAEGSVRVALNAIETVRRINGSMGPPHEVAHALFVAPRDLARFHALNATAEMSPALWHIRSPELAGLDAGCKFATLQRSGARVTIGSDWIITENPNLFPALQGMLDRGEESVDLATALEMMTLAGARAIGLDHRIGSLAPGKSADFIVLDRPLFDVPLAQIGATRVLRTVFEGKTVHLAS